MLPTSFVECFRQALSATPPHKLPAPRRGGAMDAELTDAATREAIRAMLADRISEATMKLVLAELGNFDNASGKWARARPRSPRRF